LSRTTAALDRVLNQQRATVPSQVACIERRNLLTHTGGIVSAQYLANCRAQNVNLSGIVLGKKLSVDNVYFSEAVSIVYEIGVKLCHVLWRKFAEKERQKADSALNNLGYSLIYAGAYDIAESLLTFGSKVFKKHSSESARRMMIVNLANAVRLQGRREEAARILDNEDWSAVDDNFKICVAAVRESVAEVVRLMPIIGSKDYPNAEDYRTWPVFRGMGGDKQFIATFEDVFGEPFVTSSAMEIQQPEAESIDPARIDGKENLLVH